MGVLVVVQGGTWRSSGGRERNRVTDELFVENQLNISSCAEHLSHAKKDWM